jgi:virginiamycin B lyase
VGVSTHERARRPEPPGRAAPAPRATGLAAVLLAALLVFTPVLASRANAFVYWSNSEGASSPDDSFATIGRANLDGTGANQSFIAEADFATGLAVDAQHVYWGNRFYDTIARANLDGTGADQSFITGASPPGGVRVPAGLAVDAEHLYWASLNGTIGRSNLDGTDVEQSFITGASSPLGVAVDDSHVYWANTDANAIGRANLDGSGVDQAFISGVLSPGGVALDGGHLYWTSFAISGTIGRANLDGTGLEPSFITGASFPLGVAIDEEHVYWANRFDGTIGRAGLDGTRANQGFITGARGPRGVAVDALRSFGFGKLKRNKSRGTARLTINVPAPGELELAKTNEVKGKRKRAEAGGKVRLPIKPRGMARRSLKRKGRARVEATVTYTPDGSDPNVVANTDTRALKLVRR